MALIGTREMLAQALDGGYAVGGYVAFSADIMRSVMTACQARRAPVMIICSPPDYARMGAAATVKIAAALAEDLGLDVALHLDHASTYEEVTEAIDAGFTSVMIDGSQGEFADNVALTSKVVGYARPRGIPVEAEIGAMGTVEGAAAECAGGPRTEFTDPAMAREFVTRTGCDYLAVSIGNAHGLYSRAPSLDLDLLAEIRDAAGIPLVLHGGSGTPEDQLRAAVARGIAKVNVGSELARDFNAVYIPMITEDRVWWAVALEKAAQAVEKTVGRWIDLLGSAGRT